MEATLEHDPWERRRHDFGDIARVATAIVVALVIAVGLAWLVLEILSDERRDPVYRDAYEQGRSIGPTSGWLDDGSRIGAATFFDSDGTVCTLFGPPGDRGDELHCVPDTAEEVDAINWKVDPERSVDLTVMVVDGEAPDVAFGFDGTTPAHATSRFPIAKPGVVVVYVGPPWDSLDVDTGSSG